MTITIENIQSHHKAGIQALVEALNQVDHLAYSLTDEWLDYIIQQTSESVFIAMNQEKVVGIATCMINEMDQGHAVINIAIHPHYRKQGIGSHLHNRVLDYTKSKQIKTIEAYVKQRLDSSLRFAKERGLLPVLYAWQMDLDISKADLQWQDSNPRALRFRQATINDSETYAAIINAVFGDALNQSVLQQLLQDHSIWVYLLEEKGKVLGSTTIQLKNNLSLGYIYDVAILELYRGQGLGSYMLKESIKHLRNQKMDKASLTVTGDNKKALALYQKLGFEEVDMDILMSTMAIKD